MRIFEEAPTMTTIPQELTRLAPRNAAARILDASRSRGSWLDEFVEALEAGASRSELQRVLGTWGLSQSEAARLFGVSRQAVGKWLANGVPVERSGAIADLAAATDQLVQHLKRERIPAVVRRPAAKLEGASLLDWVAAGRTHDVLRACRAMFEVDRLHV